MALCLSARPWRTSSRRYGRSCAYDELVGELKLRASSRNTERQHNNGTIHKFSPPTVPKKYTIFVSFYLSAVSSNNSLKFLF
jgi:hypothetical protein